MTTKSMNLRGRAAWLALLLAAALAPVWGADGVPVRHQRSLWWDKAGTLTVEDDGLRFTAVSKGKEGEAVFLAWDAIQQLKLEQRAVKIVTYQDQRWQLGRDRHFHFVAEEDPGFGSWEATLRETLGDRLVLAIPADSTEAVQWRIPAKRNGFPSGAEGILLYDGQSLQFESAKRGESRRWPLAQIETATRVSARELLVVAPERAMADQGGMRSFSFQLKQPLGDRELRDLWRSIEAAHGRKLRFQPGQ